MNGNIRSVVACLAVIQVVVLPFIGLVAEAQPRGEVKLLALGDVNLGRAVGQEILKGDTLYPFAAALDTLASYYLVFANLESNLSDQGGETQDPRNNLIFTGPPAGAWSLRKAGVGVVSIANNHAMDYGEQAHRETRAYLGSAGVPYAGDPPDSTGICRPAIVTKNGIRMAFFGVTEFVNDNPRGWRKVVAEADTAPLLRGIRWYRDSVDFIIVSIHGGNEYADRPSAGMRKFSRAVLDGGADLILGHHPHVPQGIEERQGKLIVYSLGNFVFRQPFRYWTQRSIAVAVEIVKEAGRGAIAHWRCLPVLTGFQPRFVPAGAEADTIAERIRKLSLW